MLFHFSGAKDGLRGGLFMLAEDVPNWDIEAANIIES